MTSVALASAPATYTAPAGLPRHEGAVSPLYAERPLAADAAATTALVAARRRPPGPPTQSYGQWVGVNEAPPPAPKLPRAGFAGNELSAPLYDADQNILSAPQPEILLDPSHSTTGPTMTSLRASSALPASYMACDDPYAQTLGSHHLPSGAASAAAHDPEYAAMLADQNARDYARALVAAIPPKTLPPSTRAASLPRPSTAHLTRPPPLRAPVATTATQARMLRVVDAMTERARSLWLGPQTFTMQRLDTLRDLILERPVSEDVLRSSLQSIVEDAGRDAGPLGDALYDALEGLEAEQLTVATRGAAPYRGDYGYDDADAGSPPYETLFERRRPRPPAHPTPSLWQRVESQQNADPHVLRARTLANKVRRAQRRGMAPAGEYRKALEAQVASAARLEERRASQMGVRAAALREREEQAQQRRVAEERRRAELEARRAEAEWQQERAAAEAEKLIQHEREVRTMEEETRRARRAAAAAAASGEASGDPSRRPEWRQSAEAEAKVRQKMSELTAVVTRDSRLATDLGKSANPDEEVDNAVTSNMHSAIQMMLVLRGLKNQ